MLDLLQAALDVAKAGYEVVLVAPAGDCPLDEPGVRLHGLPAARGRLGRFLRMPRQTQMYYQVGRRLGVFRRLSDMDSPQRMHRVEAFCQEHRITVDNVDDIADELMKRFI